MHNRGDVIDSRGTICTSGLQPTTASPYRYTTSAAFGHIIMLGPCPSFSLYCDVIANEPVEGNQSEMAIQESLESYREEIKQRFEHFALYDYIVVDLF